MRLILFQFKHFCQFLVAGNFIRFAFFGCDAADKFLSAVFIQNSCRLCLINKAPASVARNWRSHGIVAVRSVT